MFDCRTDVAKGLVRIAIEQGLVEQRRSSWNVGIRTLYDWEPTMGPFKELRGFVDEFDGVRRVYVVEWLILKVCKEEAPLVCLRIMC